MATIDNLAKSITELDEKSAFELIKRLRFSRRVQKPSNKKAIKKAAKRKPKIVNVSTALSLLTPEQKAQLAKELMGG